MKIKAKYIISILIFIFSLLSFLHIDFMYKKTILFTLLFYLLVADFIIPIFLTKK